MVRRIGAYENGNRNESRHLRPCWTTTKRRDLFRDKQESTWCMRLLATVQFSLPPSQQFRPTHSQRDTQETLTWQNLGRESHWSRSNMTSLRTAGELLPVDVTDRLGIYALGHLSKRTHQCICLCSASVMALTASNCALLTLLLYLQFSWCPTIGASPLHRVNHFSRFLHTYSTLVDQRIYYPIQNRKKTTSSVKVHETGVPFWLETVNRYRLVLIDIDINLSMT